MLSFLFGSANAQTDQTIYDFKVNTIDGETVSLSKYSKKVVLIVNTASECGFTPQFSGLQKLYDSLSGKDFVILGFPCNQFGKQDPGNDKEIANFCKKNYGVTFPMFSKIAVNGENTDPLYTFLKNSAPGILQTKAIKWNFTKFLINKDGKVVKRYSSMVKPKEIVSDIEKEL